MQYSGLNKIDALLGTQDGIYQAVNNVVAYSFTVPAFSGGTNATALNASQQAAVVSLLAYVGSVTGVNFVAAAPGAGSTINFCVADLPSNFNGWCEYNGGTSYDIAIDTFGSYSYLSNFAPGSDAYQILLHEVGHALGLDHSFDGPYSLPAEQDNTSYTLMSYNWSGVRSTYSPYDLLALSWIYGGDGVGGANGIGGTNGPSVPPEAYPPVIHSISASATTVGEGTGQFSFTVTRTGELSVATTVAWAVTGTVGAADFGGILPSGVVSFAPGETSKTVMFSATDDNIIEPDESVIVTLGASTGQGAVLGDSTSVTYSLADDDTPPMISITGSAQGLEGNSGISEITFTISRTGNIGKSSEVVWAFNAASTTAADFARGVMPTGGTLTFAPGQSSIHLPIAIAGDTQIEGDEQFIISIAAIKFGTIGQGQSQGIGTIVSDDVNNTFTVSAKVASIIEGHTGTQAVEFIVTRSGVSTAPATVGWLRGGTIGADDTASQTNGVLDFAVGETSKVIRFDVYGDRLIEGDETLWVTLQGVTGMGAGLGPVIESSTVVLSDDPKGAVTVVAVKDAVNEGNAGAQVTHTFTLTRTGNLTQAGSMPWTVGGTANAADYAGARLPSGTASFAAGQASTTVKITTQGDTLFEADDTVILMLGDGDFVTPDAQKGSATVTLLNDDVPNEFRVTALQASVVEGSTVGVKTSVKFNVVRVGDVSSAASVEWAVVGVGESPADASDFGAAFPSGKLSFGIGETSKTIFVNVSQDKLAEADERFALQLKNGVGEGVSATEGTATVTVVTDDPLPQLALIASKQLAAEGNSGTQTVTFEVTRTGDLTGTASVQWELKGALPDSTDAADFASAQPFSGTIAFAAGENRKAIVVQLLGDTAVEASEAFTVALKSPTNAAIVAGKDAVTFTITNDDALLRSVSGTAAANEKIVLHGIKADYAVSYDPATGAVKVLDGMAGRDGELTLSNVEVVQFGDQSIQVLPNAAEKVLVQFGHAVYGAQGLDQVVYGLGMSYLGNADVASLAEYVAVAFFGGMSADQMATEVLANLQVSAETLGGPNAQANYGATQALLTGMFTGDSTVRGPALQAVLDVLGTLEGDAVYGQVAAAYNDRISIEWVAEFSGHAATLVGIPASLVELPLG